MTSQQTIEKYKKIIQNAEREEAMLQGKLEETNSQLEELCGSSNDDKVSAVIEKQETELEDLKDKFQEILEELEKCKWE